MSELKNSAGILTAYAKDNAIEFDRYVFECYWDAGHGQDGFRLPFPQVQQLYALCGWFLSLDRPGQRALEEALAKAIDED